jgi:hypothetical protein
MNNNQKKFAEIIAKAWTNESFKQRLLMHPKQTLEQEGVHTSSKDVKIVENSHNTTYYVLPEKPKGNLSDRELREIAAAEAAIIKPDCM